MLTSVREQLVNIIRLLAEQVSGVVVQDGENVDQRAGAAG